MEKAAVDEQGLMIPLIDFSKFLEGTPAQRKETADAILRGFQTAGFIYLSNLPITPSLRKHVFDTSANFFQQLTLDEKLALGWTTPEANRGYSAPGREKNTQLTDVNEVAKLKEGSPDIKESFEIGREADPEFTNQWPDEAALPQVAGFRDIMVDFHERCRRIHVEVMRAIAVGIGLEDEGYFDSFVDGGDNTLRLLHYPAVKSEVFRVNPGQARTGAHSDYGSITLLFQDSAGGLQVQSPSGQFVDATPIEDTCVVNAGDLLARWSNDTIKSTIHRVVEPPRKADEHPARYSIAYFCNPNFDSQIEAIPGTYAGEADRKYEGVNTGEYLVKRLAATY
ncbi:thymine dioxygenase [Cryphonectria parasitica EP155]|uniref:Thymine dioxygenase n=1 Tax=Cryphonectria parasitica (strain ATCC 38755 / EP155) TaxID=660469 RepID=A0A9P4YC75_CRYP1|nr:thymine dioxygenase [Cryphonectria parasitica EP155]KAF3770380.1 thymine dioxygenase [Cryphonectria parasitica EP155]